MVIDILRQEHRPRAHSLKGTELPAQTARIERQRTEGAMTTTQHDPYPFVTKVIDLFGDWLKQRRELNELMEFAADPGELERVARELNVTSAGLEMLVRQSSQGANELSYTLTALG